MSTDFMNVFLLNYHSSLMNRTKRKFIKNENAHYCKKHKNCIFTWHMKRNQSRGCKGCKRKWRANAILTELSTNIYPQLTSYHRPCFPKTITSSSCHTSPSLWPSWTELQTWRHLSLDLRVRGYGSPRFGCLPNWKCHDGDRERFGAFLDISLCQILKTKKNC